MLDEEPRKTPYNDCQTMLDAAEFTQAQPWIRRLPDAGESIRTHPWLKCWHHDWRGIVLDPYDHQTTHDTEIWTCSCRLPFDGGFLSLSQTHNSLTIGQKTGPRASRTLSTDAFSSRQKVIRYMTSSSSFSTAVDRATSFVSRLSLCRTASMFFSP